MPVTIISFGHQYGPRPDEAHLLVDLRTGFRNPAPHLSVDTVFPDVGVFAHVMATPGIPALVDALVAATDTLVAVQEHVVVAVGCAGGHHRAPSVAAQIADRLTQRGREVTVSHRDLHTPLSPDQESEEVVDIDDPIELDGVDFALPAPPRSTEASSQARARMEALTDAWREGFTAPQMAQALADTHGLTRSRSWVLAELRRLETEGRVHQDDHGRWTPAA